MINTIGPKVAGLPSTTIPVKIFAIPNSDIEVRTPASVRSANKDLSSTRGKITCDD